MDKTVYIHPEDAAPARADKALAEYFKAQTSRTKLEKQFDENKVLLDGKPIPKKFILNPNDEVLVELPPPPSTEIEGVDIPVEIVYEDEHIVVVNKPPYMVVHPGSGTGNDTLVHAMQFYTKGNLSRAGGAMRPGIVHRLDKETSGIMILAKTDEAYFRLVEMFSNRQVKKEYLAIISGVPTVRSGTIKKPIGRHPTFKTKMCVCDSESGRDAHTDWVVEQSFGNMAALVRCRIHTGRTHQIRVHMTDMGYPIMGDYTYSFQKNKFKELTPPKRVMLHAKKISFDHPVIEGKHLELQAKEPQDFIDLINELKELNK